MQHGISVASMTMYFAIAYNKNCIYLTAISHHLRVTFSKSVEKEVALDI